MKQKTEYDYPEGLTDGEKVAFDKAVKCAYEKATKEFNELMEQP